LDHWQYKDEQHQSVKRKQEYAYFVFLLCVVKREFISVGMGESYYTYPAFLSIRRKFFFNNALVLPRVVNELQQLDTIADFSIGGNSLPIMY